jgi:NAD-dependent deacetylase
MSLVSASVIALLRSAQRVVALTGGGVAAEANFLSFRESHTGGWAQYDVSELATPQAFQRNPRLVWEWYAHRRAAAERLRPGPTHQSLVALAPHYTDLTIITQAIDGLHVRAGSEQVIELNGCLSRTRCYEAGHSVNDWEDVGEIPPRCPHCGSVLRPDVIMYGEGLSQIDIRRARQAVEQCDLFLCLGAIGTIEPVASFPITARKARAKVVAITPEDSIYTLLADEVVSARPADVLPTLAMAILTRTG